MSPHAVSAVQEFADLLRQASLDSPLVSFVILYAACGWSYGRIGDRFGITKQAVSQMLKRRSKHYPELKALINTSQDGTKPRGAECPKG